MIQLIRALLIKIRIISPSVEESYMALVQGQTSADFMCKYLRLDQVERFIELHGQVKAVVDGEKKDLPPQIVLALTGLLINNSRRFHIALAQVDNLIDRGLEEQILRKKGKNIV